MRYSFLIVLILSVFFGLIFHSCDNDDDENETNISRYNEYESHKSGQNCMNCHQKGGDGEGWFSVAGTVYDSLKSNTYPNAMIRFYKGPNGTGTVKAIIEVDALGNFFTTENIDVNGLYVSARGSSGEMFMNTPLATGECNSCHGNSTGKIWVK